MMIHEIYDMTHPFFNKILISLFILFFGFLVGNIAEKFIRFTLRELRVNIFLKKGFKFRINAEKWLSLTAYYIIFFVTIYYSLQILGMTNLFLFAWIIFIMFVFLLSLVLDVKDAIINLYYFPALRTKIVKGNIIEAECIKGEVMMTSIFGIYVKENEDIHYIPNNFLIKGYSIR
ncbi:hypothetical protein C0585_05400 [Candidatus Woesearchaeota archaeon]|nr:MAG: hypothetical protein C0585_05400 [Candidatus Woesearchaeota archaeon]